MFCVFITLTLLDLRNLRENVFLCTIYNSSEQIARQTQ